MWSMGRGPLPVLRTATARPRRPCGSLLAMVGLLVVAVTGCTAPAPARPTPQATLGPDIAWRTDVAANAHTLVGDTIVATWQRGVTGIKAGTGETRWHYQPPQGFSIIGWGATSGVVALVMDDWTPTNPTAEGRSSTIGLETASGRQILDEPPTDLHPLSEYVEHGQLERFVSGKGVFVIPWFDAPRMGMAGVDAHTGALSWTTVFDGVAGVDECDVIDGSDSLLSDRPLAAVDDQLAAVAVLCAQGQFVIGFDPRSGRSRWATPLGGAEPERLIIDDDVILVAQTGPDTIIDSRGQVLFEGELPPERLVMAVSGDVMVVSGQDGATDSLVAIDLRNGRTLWSHARPGPDLRDTGRPNTYLDMTSAGPAVLGSRSTAVDPQPPEIDVNPLPAVVDRIDPLTGTVQPVVVPVAAGAGWITAVGELLVLHDGRGLVAVRLSPDGSPSKAYSPAPLDRWPDTCALLTAEQLRILWPGVDVTPVGQSGTVLGSLLRNPVRCDVTDRYGDVFATVSLRWVANDPQGAEGIATSAHAVSAGTNPYSDHPVAPLLPEVGTWAFGDPATAVTLRAGPVIATVRAWDVTVPAVEIARLVTDRLHIQGYR